MTPRPLESRRNPPPWDAIGLLLAFFLVVAVVCLVGTVFGRSAGQPGMSSGPRPTVEVKK